jgi:hypothetical protein
VTKQWEVAIERLMDAARSGRLEAIEAATRALVLAFFFEGKINQTHK